MPNDEDKITGEYQGPSIPAHHHDGAHAYNLAALRGEPVSSDMLAEFANLTLEGLQKMAREGMSEHSMVTGIALAWERMCVDSWRKAAEASRQTQHGDDDPIPPSPQPVERIM